MNTTTVRTARIRHRCACNAWINPGEQYVVHVAAPGHADLGNTRWQRQAECAECAGRYGRGHLLAVTA